jgi:phosphogluconate dehydratase
VIHPQIAAVTARVAARSTDARGDYLARMRAARQQGPARARLSCSNQAHVFAASGIDKPALRGSAANIGIVTAYNDMLSAHQPFERYPEIIRAAARAVGATAQVAGGVPAMCDGVTQGRAGMELSLFSRDVIALATGIALTHEAFDAALLLGVCDKIVPGLFMGAAAFGYLPTVFVPAGPMGPGIPNKQKAEVRQRYVEGRATREELLAAESAAYHGVGTCTFYGTANSNQMMMELMGLHVPGTAFVNPATSLRHALTAVAAQCLVRQQGAAAPFAEVIDERSIVNAIVGLMATGGSTNHTIHLISMARAVGITVNWEDMADISAVTPLLARVYPNGSADINQFHAAGGMGFVVRELLQAGLVHGDVQTVWGRGLAAYALEPVLEQSRLQWRAPPERSLDEAVLRSVATPFSAEGGLKRLRGNLGCAIVKTSAVDPQYWRIEAPARVFETQQQFTAAYQRGELDRDFVAVVRGQGPRANGMPELHQLMPELASLQSRGRRVALVTDGRLSGASGRVPAALHVTPEALAGGALARLRDGDMLCLDAVAGRLDALVDAGVLEARELVLPDEGASDFGCGRELFARLRRGVSPADQGASLIL